uniref:Peptidase_M14 domain-containing protein n=1 Tax=Strongyloides venezuelensis TaxID=75913 RepID=A0A0K0F5M8_STRVS
MVKTLQLCIYFFILICAVWNTRCGNNLNCNPPFNFYRYGRFGEIERYLKWVSYYYSDIASLKTIGTTYEGRPIYVLVVDIDKNTIKKDYFIISGVHAREWIGVSSTLFFLNKLLNNISNNYNILYKYRLHIIPVVNPDGYEYSMLIDNHWRKNRSRRQCIRNGRVSDHCCIGVDLNRNFGFSFNRNADPFECSESFNGYYPNSEAESSSLSRYALMIKPYIVVDFHAFGNLIIYPFASSNFYLPTSMNYLHVKGNNIKNEIKRKYNENYRCGLAREFLNYVVYGSSMDFYYGSVKAKYSYVVELGRHSFHPPIDNIELMGNIVYDMILMFGIE